VRFAAWLIGELCPRGGALPALVDQAHGWLRDQRLLPPPARELERLVRAARRRVEQDLLTRITAALSPAARASIDRALDEADAVTGFTSLKADPGRVGLDSVLRASTKLAFLRDLRLPGAVLSSVHPKMLERFRRRLSNESAWEVRQHPTERRHALCAVFLHAQQRAITDGLVELLIQIVHKIAVNAERKVVRELLHDFSRVHGKERLLGRIAEASLGNPDGTIREVLYPLVGEDVLINLLREYKASGPAYTKKVHTVVRTSYGGHYRRMLPEILNVLAFRCNNVRHRPILEALDWVRRHRDLNRRHAWLDQGIPIDGVVPGKWRDLVLEEDVAGRTKINRINYEICVLQSLRECLRVKEIWVEGADRYRNPDEDVPRDFGVNRELRRQRDQLARSQGEHQETELGGAESAGEERENDKAQQFEAKLRRDRPRQIDGDDAAFQRALPSVRWFNSGRAATQLSLRAANTRAAILRSSRPWRSFGLNGKSPPSRIRPSP
jgi:hypothetical protein